MVDHMAEYMIYCHTIDGDIRAETISEAQARYPMMNNQVAIAPFERTQNEIRVFSPMPLGNSHDLYGLRRRK